MANTAAKAKNPYEIIFRKGVNQGTAARARCDKCGATKEKNLSKHLPPDQVIKKFEQDGWRYAGHGRPRFHCTDCQTNKNSDAGKVDSEQAPAAPQRDEHGELAQAVGISIKSAITPSKGFLVRIPYGIWHNISKPTRIILAAEDDGSLAIHKGADDGNGLKLQQQGQGQAWVHITPRRLPRGNPQALEYATKPIHITAMMHKSAGKLVLPMRADRVFDYIREWGDPMEQKDKVVKLRPEEQPQQDKQEPSQPQQAEQQPAPATQNKSLEQEGRDLFDSLNDWVARCLEANKEVVVTQDKDGFVNARIRYMTEVDL